MDSNAATEIEIASSLLVRSRVFLDAWFLSAGVDGRSEFRPFWEEVWPFWRFNEHALESSYGNCMGWTGMQLALKVWLEHGINLREGLYK